MSHRVAFFLALAFVAFFAFDWLAHDWAWTMVLTAKGIDLITWLKIWR